MSIEGEKNNVLQYYESIAGQSQRMLLAAKAGNWEDLCAAEEECARLIEHLQQLGDKPPMSSSERERRMQILKTMLAEDAQIRDLTEPWLKQLENLLHSAGNARRLGGSYHTE